MHFEKIYFEKKAFLDRNVKGPGHNFQKTYDIPWSTNAL